MKPKPSFHRLLLGIPFFLLSPAAHAQGPDEDGDAAEVAETGETEKGNARRAKEAAERAKEAAETGDSEQENGNSGRQKEAAERAKKAAEDAKTNGTEEAGGKVKREEKAHERAKEAAGVTETEKEEGNARREEEAAERAKEAAEGADTKETEKGNSRRAKEAAERAKETGGKKDPTAEPVPEDEKAAAPGKTPETAPQPPLEKPGPAKKPEPGESEAAEKPGTPAKDRGRGETAPGTRERPEKRPAREPREDQDRGERSDAPADTPDPPADEDKPREETEPRSNDAEPTKKGTPEPAPDDPAERERAEIPATEPERQAESEVAEVTREVRRELDQRKTRIEGRDEAQAVIDEIIGPESRISRAEIAREERFRPRFERQRQGEQRLREVSPDQRRAATTYFQQRLRGREIDGPPPEFFRRSEHRGDRLAPRGEERVVERVEYGRPRYLNEGRRYVHYDSRAAIPAILMAAQAMNRVRVQPTREIAPIFYERRDVSAPRAMPLPPENYRDENSLVVSYPVDENSMISSEDILFLQGSTQFSDPYSYEVVGVMADAMKELPEEERFVIEGHASAEGSYDSNMVLSQQRAEHIVRAIVRRGVSPYRLLPVGYGESEARHPADAPEALRSRDRRVVVFRMKSEPVAAR
jgi:outer membrane protein OmpA-like peptidoglycan-associated protein